MADWQSSLPSLSKLIAFEAAYRHRNFTHAASELHYTQATVSRRVASLEAELGVTLFDRVRHAVVPTDHADVLVGAIRPALDELARVAAELRRASTKRTRLTIRSDVSLTAAVVNPIIGELQQRFPDLHIRVVSSFEPIELDTDEFDLGLQYGRNRASSFHIEPIADEEVFPVCAPELLSMLPDRPTAQDLIGHRLLHVDYGEPAWLGWKEFLSTVGGEPVDALLGPVFSTYVVCLDLAERGEGIALGWGHTVQPRIDAGHLVRIPGLTVELPDAVLTYRPKGLQPWAPVDELLSMLRLSLGS